MGFYKIWSNNFYAEQHVKTYQSNGLTHQIAGMILFKSTLYYIKLTACELFHIPYCHEKSNLANMLKTFYFTC